MAKIEILHRYTGAVLFAHEAEGNTIRLTVEAAAAARVSLRGSNLSDSDLRGSDLSYSNLYGSNLSGSDLRGSDLSCSNLYGSNLSGSDLRDSDLSGSEIPIIPHIDAEILRAIEAPGNALDMSDWHTCETTHCRAGWAIMLAGDAGRKLESAVGPSAAGALIYAASRPGQRVPYFTDFDEDALADLRACAAADPLPAEAS